MTIAFDAIASKATTSGSTTWTHTPSGTPAGVLVFIHQRQDQTDVVTAVTYGGITMTRLARIGNAGVSLASSEYAYFLGNGVPSGAQTVSVTHSSAKDCAYESITYTSSTNISKVQDYKTLSADGAAPRGTNLSLGGNTCHVSLGYATEHYALTQYAPLAGWTVRRETDHTNDCTGCETYDTVGTSDVAWGHDVSGETTRFFASIAVAVTEFSGGSNPAPISPFLMI